MSFEIIIWDVETFETIKTLKGHTDYVTSVAFSPNGTMLASGSGSINAKIIIWKLYNEQAIEELKNKISTRCLLLLQSLLYAYKHEGRKIISLLGFSELRRIFTELPLEDKELVKYLLANIANNNTHLLNFLSRFIY